MGCLYTEVLDYQQQYGFQLVSVCGSMSSFIFRVLPFICVDDVL